MIKKFLGFLVFLGAICMGYYTYKKMGPLNFLPSAAPETGYTKQVKDQILKYQKPARIEVVNYIKNPDHPFQKEIDSIKKLKIPLNKDSENYIKIQFFVDETDATAPLMAQFLYFDVKTDNLIKEESLKLE